MCKWMVKELEWVLELALELELVLAQGLEQEH
jgi:hypothetical protein